MALHNPSASVEVSKSDLMLELGLAFNLSSEDKAVAFKLASNPEFMLRFQFVQMAKNHNYFGAVDDYMKEFARICMSTGNKNISKNLERVLNTEISISNTPKHQELLSAYKDLPRELDSAVLATPQF